MGKLRCLLLGHDWYVAYRSDDEASSLVHLCCRRCHAYEKHKHSFATMPEAADAE